MNLVAFLKRFKRGCLLLSQENMLDSLNQSEAAE